MAEFRNIHTRIWKDEWFCELPEDEKLLFIYLFSNERASVCGMYELPLKFIVFETGIPKDRVSEILNSFEQNQKAYYRDGIVWVVNLRKYNDSGDSVKVRVRINKDLDSIQDCELKRMYYEYYQIPYPENKIPYPEKKSETDTDTDTETETDTKNIFRIYEREIGIITKTISDQIMEAEKEYPNEWFESAFKEAALHNKRSWAYAHTILKRWKEQGFQSDNRNGNGNKPASKTDKLRGL